MASCHQKTDSITDYFLLCSNIFPGHRYCYTVYNLTMKYFISCVLIWMPKISSWFCSFFQVTNLIALNFVIYKMKPILALFVQQIECKKQTNLVLVLAIALSEYLLNIRNRVKNFVRIACVLSCLSRVQFFATFCTVAHQTSLSMGFSGHEY